MRKIIFVYAGVFAFVIMLSVLGDHYIRQSSSEQKLNGRTTIVIDAGHGGMDGGAVSCTGVNESSINLEITLRLDDLFHFLGYQTVMIRRTDTSVYTNGNTISQKKISDLKERVRIINGTENAFLISIHQNMFQESKYSGAQVFYAPTEHSKEVAEFLQESICNTINPGSNRKTKKAAGVYIMEHVQCGAVLVECGFLSNPEEEQKLQSPDYQKQLCCVIAASFASFNPNT